MSNETARDMGALEGTDQMAGEQNAVDAAATENFLSGVARRRSWIAAGTIVGLLGATAFVLLVPPRYEAVATVLLDAPQRLASQAGISPGEAARAQALVPSDLARAAVERLGLAANADFAGPEGSGGDAADAFLARLKLMASLETRTVRIAFASTDPSLAARAANTVAEVAVQSRNESRQKASRALETWLAKKIEDGKARVADADAKVEAARAEARPASGADQPQAESQSPPSRDLAAKVSAARASEAGAAGKAALLRQLEQEGRLEDTPPELADERFRRLLDQRTALKAEIADASKTYLPLHPRMKELAAQLAAVDGQIRLAADNAARAQDGQARQAKEEGEALTQTLADQPKASAAPSNAASTAAPIAIASLRPLEAEAQLARDDLASYQQMAREAEARAAADGEGGAARILMRAGPPAEPTFPRRGPTLAAGAGAGLCLSILVAAAAALAARRRPAPPLALPATPFVALAAREPEEADVDDAPGLAELESVAAQSSAKTSADSTALVATLRRVKPKGNLVALVAGDRTGQALAVALETARALAAERATVLVDLGETQDWLADILYREERELLPMAPDALEVWGLADLVAGRAGFGAVIRRDLSTTLDVVLPGEGGAEGRIDDALTAFAAAYEAVVLHASDWRSDWARAAAILADAVIVVAPGARVGSAVDAARDGLGDLCPAVLPFALRASHGTLDRAA